jgi:NADPH:quinone reductase-like Zn-dependent oxidoreductase
MGAGVRKPKNPIPGTDVAGVVAAVGTGVTQFEVGAEVFGEVVPGFQWTNGGTYAEFVAVREDAILAKPARVTFEQAAAVPSSGLIALRSLRLGGLRAGQHVLINGAGGCVGSLALQIAKANGARVTGVDHTSKLDLLRSLGADDVIDFTQEDFTRGSTRYDIILDVASTSTLSACRRVLTCAGI